MDRKHVADNASIFDSFLNGDATSRAFHRSVVKNGKKFVALVETDRIRFIPGHYAMVSRDQLEALQQKQTVSTAEVDRMLDRLCGRPLGPGEPLYDEIDAHYIHYCSLSCDSPSNHHQRRTYWLLRS